MNEYLIIASKQGVAIIAGAVISYLISLLRAKKAELEAKDEDLKMSRRATRAILRNTIRQACKNKIKEGWVPLDEKSDILDLYDVYEQLIKRDGITNGVIDDCIVQVRNLPNKEVI